MFLYESYKIWFSFLTPIFRLLIFPGFQAKNIWPNEKELSLIHWKTGLSGLSWI